MTEGGQLPAFELLITTLELSGGSVLASSPNPLGGWVEGRMAAHLGYPGTAVAFSREQHLPLLPTADSHHMPNLPCQNLIP